MNILALTPATSQAVKAQLRQDGLLFERAQIDKYDAQFSEVVTASNAVVKGSLFFSIGLYVLLNLAAVALAIYYHTFNLVGVLAPAVICTVVLIITTAIFRNINTRKETVINPLYLVDNQFVFNFNDGVVATPTLFYRLPTAKLQKITLAPHRITKRHCLGRAIFTFAVAGYTVTHTIHQADLTAITQVIKTRFPALVDKITVDRQGYYREWAHGTVLGLIFLLVGYLPLVIDFCLRDMPLLPYLAQANLLLLPTFFGNLGLCFLLFNAVQIFNRIWGQRHLDLYR